MFAVPENTVALPSSAVAVHPVRVALQVALDRDRWKHLLRYDPEERFSTLIEKTDDQEIWLMSWLPGQTATLHDHAQTTGAFTVVSGVLTEVVTTRIQVVHQLVEGQSRVWGPGYVHQVRNDGTDPAISIHVYRHGTRAMNAYRYDPVTGPVR
ncbi:cysteine dioxygenase [Lentzea sp. NBRC 105346]|uniref:cysteine dioxygenase n=1 Tax=Lentzea sp. NBRC 105346 TaxID=3032205 RepID=UPI0024A21C2D|nr:cysteine dioxygenase family protein [Lentzea sp. NBRC 105346]GLZ35485.1 cysteine dioxygenase [Lentzea sp. NBRC 105346]